MMDENSSTSGCFGHETDVTLNCIGNNINGMDYYFFRIYYIIYDMLHIDFIKFKKIIKK